MQTIPKLLLRATAFSAQKHRDQRRKDAQASPYINHPLELVSLLIEEARIADPAVLMAALLHDTLEDTQTTVQELVATFGGWVCSLVLELSDNPHLKKRRRKALQVKHARRLSKRARWIKLADKICNLRDVASNPPPNWSLRRQIDYFDWTRSVVGGLRGSHQRLEALFDEVYSRRHYPQRWRQHRKPAVHGAYPFCVDL